MKDSLPSGRFLTTRWSVVLEAGRTEGGSSTRRALEALCKSYWFPIYAFVRRRGNDADDAADLTQEFFARLFERQDLARARPELGRFRSFLLVATKNFLANDWDRRTADKRGGGRTPLSFDVEDAEERYRREPVDDWTPERAFARSWALTLLDAVLERLGGDYENAGKGALFEALRGTLVAGREAPPYVELADQLGLSEGAVKVAAHRLRQRYKELLRAEISETLADPGDVEDEIRGLFEALG